MRVSMLLCRRLHGTVPSPDSNWPPGSSGEPCLSDGAPTRVNPIRCSTGGHEEPIGKWHDRKDFDCGETALNEFLQRYARKNHEMGGAKTFLAINDADSKTTLGYYSLSPASIAYARTPE